MSGYGAYGEQVGIERVKDYIAHQEERHKRETFQEEYVRFLKEHDLTRNTYGLIVCRPVGASPSARDSQP